MPPEREVPRGDAPASRLRFDRAETAPLANVRRGPSWKRTAVRFTEEVKKPAAIQTETASFSEPEEEADVRDEAPVLTEETSGQDVPKAIFRQTGKQVAAASVRGKSGSKLRQESSQPKASDRLHHEGETTAAAAKKPPKPGEKLYREYRRMERRGEKLERTQEKLAKQKPVKTPGPVKQAAGFAGRSVQNYVHGKVYEVEHENVGIEAAHRAELAGEAVSRETVRFTKERIRSYPSRTVKRAERAHVRAAADYRFNQTVLEHLEMKGNALSRLWRKRRQHRQYEKQARKAAKRSAQATGKAAEVSGKLISRAAGFAKGHPLAIAAGLVFLMIVMLFQSCATSMTAITEGITGSVAVTTYPAEDADLFGAESAYAGMEADLQSRMDNYECDHDYDEYVFELDTIEHDPYVLLSILSAFHPDGWTLSDVQADMRSLFAQQFTLTESAVTETRYRTETQTKTRTVTDPDTGTVTTEEYEEEVEVPYDYTICTVTLDNYNLSHLPVFIMSQEQLSRYSLYMKTLGNRPDLFPASPYVNKYGSAVAGYTIPPEALSDEKFAAMIREAEKYLGYPYVWGGSSPATSFDCSGFVCWVINNCGVGWNVGRLGSDGLYFNACTPVSPADARPGDLIFFQKTYDTPYTSHVGIYVGNGMMIHCGDPIRYVSIETSYWQSHFYGFGRLP